MCSGARGLAPFREKMRGELAGLVSGQGIDQIDNLASLADKDACRGFAHFKWPGIVVRCHSRLLRLDENFADSGQRSIMKHQALTMLKGPLRGCVVERPINQSITVPIAPLA